MSTQIVVNRVWEYRRKSATFYFFEGHRKEVSGTTRVRQAPRYAVIEETENSFLAPIRKLLKVCKTEREALAVQRLLS